MLKPLSTTGIGSLPHRNAADACELIFRTFDIPFWPQLPNTSFREYMIPQYSEGMPFLRIDPDRQTVWIERNRSDELERFYEGWSEAAKIAISIDYAKGLHTFIGMMKGRHFDCIKGHTTGPLTFTLGLKDSEGKAVFFDEELREISLMILKAKIRWQIDLLKTVSEKVIIFVDEPILSALGSSAYLGVSGDEARRLLTETVSAIREAGGISGIHCCGNADWPMVFASGADIVNFDAYDYLDTLAIYPDEIRDFFDRGGRLAWGIVPTSDAIAKENPDSVKAKFEAGMKTLGRHLPETLLQERMLLTPSCGTGSRSMAETLKIFQILIRLKESFA